MDIAGSMNITFKADIAALVQDRKSVLYWVIAPGANVGGIGAGLVRMVRPWNEWLIVWGYDIDSPPPVVDEAAAIEIVRSLIGVPDLHVEITGTSLWGNNEMYATELQRVRVFCVGDAIHRHPPSNGLSSNTSIQDSYNLAGSRPRYCGVRPTRRCSTPTRPRERRSPSRSSSAPTNPAASSATSSMRSVFPTPWARTRCAPRSRSARTTPPPAPPNVPPSPGPWSSRTTNSMRTASNWASSISPRRSSPRVPNGPRPTGIPSCTTNPRRFPDHAFRTPGWAAPAIGSRPMTSRR